MSKKRKLGVASLVLALSVLAFAGCAAQPAEDADTGVSLTGLDEKAAWQTSDSTDPEELAAGVYEGLAERAEAHPARVITYDDGTTVQRTPTPAVDSTVAVRGNISYNTYRLDADNRGCQGCHDDLAELCNEIPGYPHPVLTNSLGIEYNVDMCMDCHYALFGTVYDDFSGLMHEIHGDKNERFADMGGDCWSCHYALTTEAEGGMHLWEQVRHRVLHGITKVSADKMTGSFSYDQNVVQAAEDVFQYDYLRGPENDYGHLTWAMHRLGVVPDPATDGVFDNWSITVDGEVANPVTMTLPELIDAVPSEKAIVQYQCVNNPHGGSYIANIEITGIPLMSLFEYLGIDEETARSIKYTSADGGTANMDLDWIRQYGGWIAYESSGEPLPWGGGYPAMVFIGGGVDAPKDRRGIVDIQVSSDPYKPDKYDPGAPDLDGVMFAHPNVGICYLREGQVIPTGQPFTFQGYAASIRSGISNIELSMDQGKTWQKFDTPDNDPTKWTWWEYAWTPEAAGCYTISVRATADDGTPTCDPVEMMVNVQDPSEVS